MSIKLTNSSFTIYRYIDKEENSAEILLAITSQMQKTAIKLINERLSNVSYIPTNSIGFVAWKKHNNTMVRVGGGRLCLGYRNKFQKGQLSWERSIKKAILNNKKIINFLTLSRNNSKKSQITAFGLNGIAVKTKYEGKGHGLALLKARLFIAYLIAKKLGLKNAWITTGIRKEAHSLYGIDKDLRNSSKGWIYLNKITGRDGITRSLLCAPLKSVLVKYKVNKNLKVSQKVDKFLANFLNSLGF